MRCELRVDGIAPDLRVMDVGGLVQREVAAGGVGGVVVLLESGSFGGGDGGDARLVGVERSERGGGLRGHGIAEGGDERGGFRLHGAGADFGFGCAEGGGEIHPEVGVGTRWAGVESFFVHQIFEDGAAEG